MCHYIIKKPLAIVLSGVGREVGTDDGAMKLTYDTSLIGIVITNPLLYNEHSIIKNFKKEIKSILVL
jgi:hypothetical protein